MESNWKKTELNTTPKMKEAVKKDETVRFAVSIDKKLHRKFKMYSLTQDKNMSAIICDYIESLVANAP